MAKQIRVDFDTDSETYQPMDFMRVFKIGKFTILARVGFDIETPSEEGAPKGYTVWFETTLYPLGLISKKIRPKGTLEDAVDELKALTKNNADEFLVGVLFALKGSSEVWA